MTQQTEIPPPFDRYEFERLQRKDALGETWRALDCQSGEKMDLRLLPAWVNRTELEVFVHQIQEITHPGLITTRGLVLDGSRAAVVIESCEGETIFQRRVRRPRRHFEVSEIKPWLRAMVEVLEHLHRLQIPHGALHGGSFLVEGTDLKLTDLAVSRLMRPQARFDGAAVLPPSAMSPQAMNGEEPAIADDIYALAALVYDLLTGAPVFSSGDVSSQVATAIPPSIQQRRAQLEIQSAPVPQAWEDWLAAALSKTPGQRPALAELAELLRSGSFRAAATSRGSTSPAAATASAERPPGKLPALARSFNHLIIGGAVLTVLALGLGVYFLKIAPRNEFKKQITQTFSTAQNFDTDNPSDHASAMGQWDAFLKEWQTRVTVDYPEFQPIVTAAKEQRQARLEQKAQEEEQARVEAEEARKLYIAKVRAQYLTAQAKAGSAGDDREAAVEVWTAFVNQHDIEYQGEKPPELAQEMADAKASLAALVKAITDNQRLVEEERKKADAELARLRQSLADPTAGAGYKIGLVESYLTGLNAVPPMVQGDAQIQEMRSLADQLLPPLKLQAEAETPKEPLDIKNLFAASPCKDFSDNGRKRILLEAQKTLKEQNLYTGEPDGSSGKGTHEAIIAFQKSKNLVPSAALDAPTLAALGLVEFNDDAAPMTAARRSSSRSKSKPVEEKGFFKKVGDGASSVGKSIGGLFGGDKKK